MTKSERIVIAVATFRRPMELARLLTSIAGSDLEGLDVSIVIVDNDKHETARPVVEGFECACEIFYVVESDPGIASARNAALDVLARGAFDYVIFVDDDEWVAHDWLRRLIDAASASGADVVTGPVRTLAGETAPRWMREGGFFDRREPADMSALATAATNNTLLSVASWRRFGSPRFDPSFSFTGGSDTDFFTRIVRISGARIVFCALAVVFEDVPSDRSSFRWFIRRQFRIGQVIYRVESRYGRPVDRAKMGILHLGYGLMATLWGVASRRRLMAYPLTKLFRGLGMIAASSGYRIEEYKRVH